jgi:hypothetical protein
VLLTFASSKKLKAQQEASFLHCSTFFYQAWSRQARELFIYKPFFRHCVNIAERGLSHECFEISVNYHVRTYFGGPLARPGDARWILFFKYPCFVKLYLTSRTGFRTYHAACHGFTEKYKRSLHVRNY